MRSTDKVSFITGTECNADRSSLNIHLAFFSVDFMWMEER